MSNILTKYLSKGDLKELKILRDNIKENEVIITCIGLYNHGKSTLLNALIGDFRNQTFKTADIRETSKNKKVKREHLTFVDTPGLNARVFDDKRVRDAIKSSDINLFVHNVNTGELTQKEMDFLLSVHEKWVNPKQFIERTIFIISRIDEINKEEDIERTIYKMKQQVKDVFGVAPIFIPVSALRYSKGKLESKNILIQKSNIVALESNIQSLYNKISKQILETKVKRLHDRYEELINRLTGRGEEKLLKLSQLKAQKKKNDLALQKNISTIESTLKSKYQRLKEVV